MGVLESIAAIATAITGLIGLGYFVFKKYKISSLEKRSKLELELALEIQNAKTDQERERLASELYRLRNKR